MRNRFFVSLFTLFCCLLGAPEAGAQEFWTGAVSTSWFDGNNWLSGQVPDASTNVTIGGAPLLPEISSGVGSVGDIDVLAGATVTISGTGTLETHGAVRLLTAAGQTGVFNLDTDTTALKVNGAWTQDDAAAVVSNGGRVVFEGGASLGGSAVAIPFARLSTGTTTLLSNVSVENLDATGGVSAGAGFAWEFSAPTATLASGAQPIHLVRISAGVVTVGTSVIQELELTGGEMFVNIASDVQFATRLELIGGKVGFGNLSTSVLRVLGDLICGSAVTWGSGYVDMDGPATTISGPGGTTGHMSRCRLKSGSTALLTNVEIDAWLGNVGGATTGEWFEMVGSFAFLSGGGNLHRLRILSGLTNSFNCSADEFELQGGTFSVVGGQTFNAGVSADLVGGSMAWSNPISANFRCQGTLIASSGVTFGDGFIDMDGTTTISGPGGGPARIGKLRLFSGVCTLLAPVQIDFELQSAGGTSAGDWFEMVGTDSTISSTSGSSHQVRITGGKCSADGATVDTLEITGGILEVPSGEIMTVTGDANFLGGQLQFATDLFPTAARLDVLGNVAQTALAGAATMSSKGSLRCMGTWTANAALDLGESFVEFGEGSSVTGLVSEFHNVRIPAGSTPVSLLAPVRVSGRLESDGGVTQGQWFEMTGPSAVLATTDDSLHEVRILSGVTTVEVATLDKLQLLGGELTVPAGKTLTIVNALELLGGTLAMDPTDSGTDARIIASGTVTQLGTGAALTTGSGGTLRCDGIWLGNAPIDLDKSFVEMGPNSTIIGSAVSFGRLRLAENAAVSLNALVPVTTELVAETGSSTVGFFALEAQPGIGNTMAFSGEGQISELSIVNGRVDAAGAHVGVLKLQGGVFAATGVGPDTEAASLSLEGGEVLVREGATLLVTGDATLTSGSVGFEVDAGDGAGLDAIFQVDGSVHQIGATAAVTTIANGALRCRGLWTGDTPIDLGLSRVELGSASGSTSIGGLAPGFGNLRIVDGLVTLTVPVPVTGRLECESGTSTGDWFELGGPAAELASGENSLHAVRIVAGVVLGLDSQVEDMELVGGELLIDAASTVTVNQDLEMIAGTLAFANDLGASSARLEVLGNAHQLGTAPGSVSHSDAVLSVAGNFIGDGPSVYGSAWIELQPGARLLGSAPVITRLRIAGPKVQAAFGPQPEQATIAVGVGVTLDFTVEVGSRLLVESGGLVLLMPSTLIAGELEVAGGTLLGLGSTTTVTVSSTGRLALLGGAGSPAEVTGFGIGGYTLQIDGELACRNFAFRDMGASGVVVGPGATIGKEGVHAGVFDRGLGVAGGVLLDLQMPGTYDMVGIDFVGQGGDSNARRLANPGLGEVTFHAYGGGSGGEGAEDDPSQSPTGDLDGLLVWQILGHADLAALDISSDEETVLGWPLNIDFSVIDQGGVTATGPWTDRLILTSNDIVGDADDVFLAEYAHPGDELSGGLYQILDAPLLPSVEVGTWQVALVTDANDAVDEQLVEENNTLLSAPFEVYATPRPDLLAGGMTGPAAATDGEVVSVSWTVFSDGLGPAVGTWEDRVYLSDDMVWGGDFLLSNFAIAVGEESGGFAVGTSYTEIQDVTLPLGISGDYYFIIRTDSVDDVSEETDEDNNVLVLDTAVTVTQLDLPDLVGSFEPVTSPLGALYINSAVDLNWLVTNDDADVNGLGSANGPIHTQFWYSIDNILDPLVDTLVFAHLHEGLVGPGGDFGEVQSIDLPSLPGTWWLFGETDDQAAIAEGDESNNKWEAILNVAATSWTGSVATTFVEGLSSTGVGTQPITMTGQSTKKGTAILEPNADLTVRVRRGDTRRVFPVTTNALGAYTFVFEPMVGEAGLFEVFCDHPAIEENPLAPQASFTLVGVHPTPTSFSKVLITGELVPISIGLDNPGELPLTGISATVTGVPAHLSISNLVVPTDLAGGAGDVLSFDLTAITDSPTPSVEDLLTIDISMDVAGLPTLAASTTGAIWVTSFAPSISAPDMPKALSLSATETTGLTFHVVNSGGAPATGVTVAIDSALDHGLSCFTVEPFVLLSPPSLGTLAPGSSAAIELAFMPGDCTALSVGSSVSGYQVTVTSDQGVDVFSVNLSVAANPLTSLSVRVQDVATWWHSGGFPLGGTGPLLTGAEVVLTGSDGVQHFQSTAVGGIALFSPLAPGTYDVSVHGPLGANTHGSWSGPISVSKGQATLVNAYLPALDASYLITGNEPFGASLGELDFSSSSTASNLPQASHLEITGQLLDLEMAVGESKQFDLTLKNLGGAPVFGMELILPDLSDFDVTLEYAFLGDLLKGESTTAAIVVTRTGLGNPCDLGTGWGVRSYTFGDRAIWRWTPLFLSAPDSAGCTSFVVGGAPPPNLPTPSASPPTGPPQLMGPGVPPLLGAGSNNGADPLTPLAPAPAVFTFPLGS